MASDREGTSGCERRQLSVHLGNAHFRGNYVSLDSAKIRDGETPTARAIFSILSAEIFRSARSTAPI